MPIKNEVMKTTINFKKMLMVLMIAVGSEAKSQADVQPKINTYDFINPRGGNELISYASDKYGNRVLLYFEEVSNFNFCGMCGASDGEKGYRVIYFTNDWNFKKYEDFLTESCIENIYDTKMTKSKEGKILKFNIQKTTVSPAYTLTVDVKNASVIKSK